MNNSPINMMEIDEVNNNIVSSTNNNNILMMDIMEDMMDSKKISCLNGKCLWGFDKKTGRCMSTQAMQSLYDLRQNNLLCDAVLRLEDGGVFPIHRVILSACSLYFRYFKI